MQSTGDPRHHPGLLILAAFPVGGAQVPDRDRAMDKSPINRREWFSR